MGDENYTAPASPSVRGEANVEIVGARKVKKTLQFTDHHGVAIFEGDIALGPSAEFKKDGRYLPMGSGIPGSEFRWPKGIVPYEVALDLDLSERVYAAVAHWNEQTKLRLIERTGANASAFKDFLSFEGGSSCWSYVGRQGGKQVISVGPLCKKGNIIHEIGHAVGLWHEQSRVDRENFVKIFWENISEDDRHNFEQHILDGEDLGNYDYASIMHYPAQAFSINGLPTIEAKGQQPIGQRDKLSAGDLLAIELLYPELYS